MTEFIELTDYGKTVVNVSRIIAIRKTTKTSYMVYVSTIHPGPVNSILHCDGDYIEFLSKLKVTRA